MKTWYRAFLRAKSGTLLGGVKYHLSTYFLTEQEANDWLAVIVESNRLAGRDVGEHGVKTIRLTTGR